MIEIGYHASQEQFAPSDLVRFAVCAEAAGFDFVMSADHLNPWSALQGHSGYTWSWLGAAMAKTTTIKFGSIAIPTGMRYHPVMIAQAVATLAQMFPDRMQWIAAGSGEALNEMVVSKYWPGKEERNARLKEGIEIIRMLWRGQTVDNTEGYHFVRNAKIWCLPKQPVAIFGAALSVDTTEYLAGSVEGLVTVYSDDGQLENIIAAFRKAGPGKKVYVQVHVGWHENKEIAIKQAFEQWRNNLLPPAQSENLSSVAMFDEMSKHVTMEDLKGQVFIGSDPYYFIKIIRHCISLHIDGIIFHNTCVNQEAFIDFFGGKVLPLLAEV